MNNKIIIGKSKCGKTVFAKNLISNFSRKEPKRKFIIFDTKGSWENQISVESLKLNVMRFPKNIFPPYYLDILARSICDCFGIDNSLRERIEETLYELYAENNVFNETYDPKWANENSKDITLRNFYDKCVQKKKNDLSLTDETGWDTILNRLCLFKCDGFLENRLFGNEQGNSIDFILEQKNHLVLNMRDLYFASGAFFCCLLVKTFCKTSFIDDLMFVLDDCSFVFDNYPYFLFEDNLYDKRENIRFTLLIESIKNVQGNIIGGLDHCFNEIYIGKFYNPIQSINNAMNIEFLNKEECEKVVNLKYGEFLRKK